MSTDVTVILPSYNEAENLPSVVGEIFEHLEAGALKFEILIVDDGSKDGTRRVAADLAHQYEQVRAVRLRHNLGKSGALQIGLREATGDRIVLMDADGQDDPRRSRYYSGLSTAASTSSPVVAPTAKTASSSAARRSSTTR